MINAHSKEDAFKKACCNPDSENYTTTCTADECMAWRWFVDTYTVEKDGELEIESAPSGEGYCGLAGRPSD